MSHHPERTARNVRPVNQPPSKQYVLAHEFGHTLGLSDEYTYNPGGNSISAADKDNLMNYGGDKSKLRYNQWRTVNP